LGSKFSCIYERAFLNQDAKPFQIANLKAILQTNLFPVPFSIAKGGIIWDHILIKVILKNF